MSITKTLAIEEEKKAPLDYCLRQICSAMSPSNFALTNPEVLEKIRETKGESLYQGLRLFIEDQAKSPQFLNVCMSGGGDFVLGENLASTPGKVIFENALMQLIQYEPSTTKVHNKPLLIVPSWVNKYYILDLQEKNSLVKWAVDHGFTVFMISWVNPDQQYRDVGFEDYMRSGILQAIDQVKSMCNVESVNTAGYCLGGILLASTLAYLKARGEDAIASATYLASSVDFEDPGEMGMFLNDEMVSVFEKTIEDAGYLDGRLLSIGFNLLRENDLYWNYFIQNYLKGERPPTFDILYWNSDNTNVPAKTHRFVLRDLHVDNGLIKSDAISLLGVPLDLAKVDTPLYVLATDKDHIAKWQSTYSAVSVQGGERRFVLAGSGHIAGVVNPPAANKYYHYTNNELPENPELWLDSADKQPGSWWVDWHDWLVGYSGELVSARTIRRDCIIEDAPGRYVKRRL